MSGDNDSYTTPSTTDQIQATMIERLEATLGEVDPELLSQLAALFLEDASETMAKMARCIADGDIEGLRESAHCLKGSAASMGLTTLAALALPLEMAGREGTLEGTSTMLSRAEAEYAQVEKVLREPST